MPIAPVVEPVITQSVLPNLFATQPGITIDFRFDYSNLDQIDLTVLNIFAHVQYLTPQGIGGYVAVPFAYVEEESDGIFSFGGTGIGNVEVGGLFSTKVNPKTDALFRGGVAIDTADEADVTAVALSTVLPRLVDTYTSGFETTWARGQVQFRHAANNLRLGAALGFDVPVAGEGADQDGFTGIVNGMLSAGLQQGNLGLGMTFTMLQPITDDDDENVTGLNLGGDFLVNPTARIFFGLGFSLEDSSDGTSLGIGLRSTLPM